MTEPNLQQPTFHEVATAEERFALALASAPDLRDGRNIRVVQTVENDGEYPTYYVEIDRLAPDKTNVVRSDKYRIDLAWVSATEVDMEVERITAAIDAIEEDVNATGLADDIEKHIAAERIFKAVRRAGKDVLALPASPAEQALRTRLAAVTTRVVVEVFGLDPDEVRDILDDPRHVAPTESH